MARFYLHIHTRAIARGKNRAPIVFIVDRMMITIPTGEEMLLLHEHPYERSNSYDNRRQQSFHS
jgi:hypothetical protein